MRFASWLTLVTAVPAVALAILGGCEVVADLGRYGSSPLPDRPDPPDACNACGSRCCAQGSTCLGTEGAGTCSDDIVEVSAGTESSCAVLADGSLWCWGGNQFGTLGVEPEGDSSCVNGGVSVACRPKPVRVPGLSDVAHVSAGEYFVCAIKRDSSVWCWGKNAKGVLGHEAGTSGDRPCPVSLEPDAGSEPCNPTPQRVADLRALEVSSGALHVCALQLDGAVACWGTNKEWELGEPSAAVSERATPRVIPSIPPSVHVATGQSWHSCAIAADGGAVWCWGNASHGELGHPQELDKDCKEGCLPMPVSTAAIGEDGGAMYQPFEGATEVRAGFLFSCARHRSGQVFCWGDESIGTVGGPTDGGIQRAPVAIAGLSNAQTIDARFQHACALLEDGSVRCWGDNTLGSLGIGNIAGERCMPENSGTRQTCQRVPQAVLSNGAMAGITTGVASTFAWSDDRRSIWGWGSNDPARLGHTPRTQDDLTNCNDQLRSLCNPFPRRVIPFP
ncbi:RCC1 domain-containing protein [Pendulispora albinea]|uniref:BNR repeat domain protein n=1 Tax=Pendulispora albinea TaxID=2741071 RepID=A0ABZ2LQF0_9BACT